MRRTALSRWLCFLHNWTGWRKSPGECVLVNICLRCGKTKRREGEHDFTAWGDCTDENWAQYYGATQTRKFVRTVQRRHCKTCNLRIDRYLNA